jgi:hypothetical protein
MAVATKTALSPAPSPSVATGVPDLPVPRLNPEPVKLDFAANPTHYPVYGNVKVKKAKPRQSPRVDLSPRLELSLNVQCDAAQEQDAEGEWWLSAMR